VAVYPNSQLGGDEKTKSALVESFSITRGGPLYWLMAHISISKDENRQVILRTVSSVLVTWLPLLVLSLIQGQAYGMQINIPFLKDLAVNARFLIAFPILTLAELGIDQKWRTIVFEFLRSGLVTEKELPSFEAVIEKTTRLRDRVFPEALMLIAAFIPSIIVNTEFLMNGVSNWHNIGTGSNQMSLAGSWFNFISTPFFRFLLFRWLWRMCIWTSFLWRVSRINLYLVATHADLAGGLDFISQGQKAFSPIVFAGGAVVAAQVGNAIAYQGATLSSMKLPMITYGVLAIIILIAPLLAVTPVLIDVRRRGLREYGALVTIHNQLFDRKWIRKEQPSDVVILGNPDPSSLIDLGSSFDVIRQMRVVPIGRRTLAVLAVAAALPMVPVILYATPADQLIRTVLGMLG
jgi:hypothetical protein